MLISSARLCVSGTHSHRFNSNTPKVRNGVRRDYEALRRQRLEEFMAGFGHITLKLKEMYQMITLGNSDSDSDT